MSQALKLITTVSVLTLSLISEVLTAETTVSQEGLTLRRPIDLVCSGDWIIAAKSFRGLCFSHRCHATHAAIGNQNRWATA